MQCPAGHQIPNHTSTGQCTPVHCAAGPLPKQLQALKKEIQRKVRSQTPPREESGIVPDGKSLAMSLSEDVNSSEMTLAESAADASNAIARGRRRSRNKILETPQNLAGGDAEEWADAKLIALLPFAVAEQEWQLHYGDDEQRAKASAKILDATGRGRKENGASAVAPIIMVQGTAIPWLSRENIVEASDVASKTSDKVTK